MTTVTDARVDELEHLDFRPACTCESGFCAHPDGVQCDAEADVILTFHHLHCCNTAETDVDGNESGPVCTTCLDGMTAAVAAHVNEVGAIARRFGAVAACQTCGAPVMHVSDVIHDVQPIR
jgi:hypothetical protein